MRLTPLRLGEVRGLALNTDRLRFGVICLVTLVWAVNFFAAIVLTDYQTDPAINTVFMTIVGGLFVSGEIAKKVKPSDKSENQKGTGDQAQ